MNALLFKSSVPLRPAEGPTDQCKQGFGTCIGSFPVLQPPLRGRDAEVHRLRRRIPFRLQWARSCFPRRRPVVATRSAPATTTASATAPTGATIDWAAHLQDDRDRRARRSTTSTSASRATTVRSSSSTASAASGRTGSRTSRASPSSGASSRSTCRASASRRCRASTITIDYYGRVVAELCDRLDLAPAVLVGNSMGGYVAAEAAIDAPEAVERLMLVSAAGISQHVVPVDRALRVGKIMALSDARLDRPAPPPHGASRAAPLDPQHGRPPPDAAAPGHRLRGPRQGLRQAGLRRRARRLHRLRLPRQPAGDRLPDRSSSGAGGRRDHPGRRRRHLRRADPGLAQADLRGHRPRRDGRAPGRVQRRAARVPAATRRARTSCDRPAAQRRLSRATTRSSAAAQVVSAPSAAEPTWRAYLPSTPVVYFGDGAS